MKQTLEDKQLNKPAKDYFEHKLKCEFSKVGFSVSGGRLDVLAYDKNNKCFHVCEGKRSSNIASIGHAIGQLIAYMSVIQENGYDFLNRISKEVKLELTDFSDFLAKEAIKVCFYVVLPKDKQVKLLAPAKQILNNMGDFGSSIGLFFASEKKCGLEMNAKPLNIQIKRKYDNSEFLKTIHEKFLESSESKGIVKNQINQRILQLKEKGGNPNLHYEVRLLRTRKNDTYRSIEIAFHLEFGKPSPSDKTQLRRKEKLQAVLLEASKELIKKGYEFNCEKWGTQWYRLYREYKTNQIELDNKILNDVLENLKVLVTISKPLLDKIYWGRKRVPKTSIQEN